MPESLIDHIRRHTTLVGNEPLDAAQAVAEWAHRRAYERPLRFRRWLRHVVTADVIQAEVDREETR